jgi:hypothetical protein
VTADAKSVTVAFGDGEGALVREVEVLHYKLRHGGSWSFYRCPECHGLARTLRLHEKPLCRRCCLARGIDYRSRGSAADAREARARRIGALVEMLNGGPARLRLWPGRVLDRRSSLELSLKRALLR